MLSHVGDHGVKTTDYNTTETFRVCQLYFCITTRKLQVDVLNKGVKERQRCFLQDIKHHQSSKLTKLNSILYRIRVI